MFRSSSGNIVIGSQNNMWAHLITDRNAVYFNKSVVSGEGFCSPYLDNLRLSTMNSSFGKDVRLTIKNSNGNLASGTFYYTLFINDKPVASKTMIMVH